jgi:hypothetical protein
MKFIDIFAAVLIGIIFPLMVFIDLDPTSHGSSLIMILIAIAEFIIVSGKIKGSWFKRLVMYLFLMMIFILVYTFYWGWNLSLLSSGSDHHNMGLGR